MEDHEKIILTYLFENYSIQEIGLNHVFTDQLNFDQNSLTQASEAIRILSQLVERGYIKYESNKNSHETYDIGMHYDGNNRKPGTLENHTIKAKLTIPGKDYIDNILRRDREEIILNKQAQSVIDTNDSVQKTNSFIWITMLFTGAAAFFQGVTFVKYDVADKLQRQLEGKDSLIKTTQKRLSQIDSAHFVLQNEKDSIEKLLNDTTKYRKIPPNK